MAEGYAHLMVLGSKGSDRNGRGQSMPFKGTAPVNPLPPSRPHLSYFYHLSIVYSNFESTNGLNHWLNQSSYDRIVSGNALTDIPRGMLY
jgi:hypothetical protein